MMTQWAKWARKLKKEQLLLLLLAGLLLLAVSFPSGEDTPASETEPAAEGLSQSRQSYCEELEEKLAAALEKVEGVGRTSVMITLKSDGKKLVEKDAERTESREERGQEESGSSLANVQERNSTVYEKNGQGGETPYVTETLEPEISGVLVVAEGGGRIKTVQEITDAVMALFGVEAHKIKVMKMN